MGIAGSLLCCGRCVTDCVTDPSVLLPLTLSAEALANNITPFTASVTASLPMQNVAAQLQSAAAAGHSSAVATVATVSAALESTWGWDRCVGGSWVAVVALGSRCRHWSRHDWHCHTSAPCNQQQSNVPVLATLPRGSAHEGAATEAVAAACDAPPPPAGPRPAARRLPKECQSPTEWFIADDQAQHIRYFVIQVGCALYIGVCSLDAATVLLCWCADAPCCELQVGWTGVLPQVLPRVFHVACALLPTRCLPLPLTSSCLQGSDNLDHWRVNLTFDPVTFEDPTLGVKVGGLGCNGLPCLMVDHFCLVKPMLQRWSTGVGPFCGRCRAGLAAPWRAVPWLTCCMCPPPASLCPQVHRGVYEAAQQLYDRFLPLVQDHLASSPFAKVGCVAWAGRIGTEWMAGPCMAGPC